MLFIWLIFLTVSASVLATIDLIVGYPSLPWWQRIPHDLGNAAFGVVLWALVVQRRHAARA